MPIILHSYSSLNNNMPYPHFLNEAPAPTTIILLKIYFVTCLIGGVGFLFNKRMKDDGLIDVIILFLAGFLFTATISPLFACIIYGVIWVCGGL